MLTIAHAGAGRDVFLNEKTTEARHTVCGESLRPESVPFLRHPSGDARVDPHMAKAAPFAQPILTHIRGLLHQTLPNVEHAIKWSMPLSTNIPGNEYLPTTKLPPSLFGWTKPWFRPNNSQ
jgi:hypothetical protein